MGVCGAAIDPGQLAGGDGEGFSAQAHKAPSVQAQKQIMAGIGEALDRVIGRGLKVAGPQHGVKQALAQAGRGVKMGSAYVGHDDSIIHIHSYDSAWKQ
jgi:hypothetical protein